MKGEEHAVDRKVVPAGRKSKLVKAGIAAFIAIVTLVLTYFNVSTVTVDQVDLFLFNFIGEMI